MLAESFGRRLGLVMAITKGPLDRAGAPFGLAVSDAKPARPARSEGANYAPPGAILFMQTVNAIFKLGTEIKPPRP